MYFKCNTAVTYILHLTLRECLDFSLVPWWNFIIWILWSLQWQDLPKSQTLCAFKQNCAEALAKHFSSL